MRTLTRAALPAALLLLVAACSGGVRTASDGVAADGEPGPSPAPGGGLAQMPEEPPAADGPVRTRGIAVVMDRGDGPPEVCLGAVAESWPPQCGGPALVGWDWREHPTHERQGQVRWGRFAVTGTWDGERLTVTSAIPAAVYDAMAPEETEPPAPGTAYSPAELEEIAREVGSRLPGAQGAYAGDGHVWVDVTYDDGSLQAWAEETYGEHVVLVRGALVDVE